MDFLRTVSVELFGMIFFILIFMALAGAFIATVIRPILRLTQRTKAAILDWSQRRILNESELSKRDAQDRALVEATFEHHKQGDDSPFMSDYKPNAKAVITPIHRSKEHKK